MANDDLTRLGEIVAGSLADLVEASASLFDGDMSDGKVPDASVNAMLMALYRFDKARKDVDSDGMDRLVRFIYLNLDQLGAELPSESLDALPELMTTWPMHTLGCLQEPENLEALGALLVHLQQPGWPSPLDEESAEHIAAMFMQADSADFQASGSDGLDESDSPSVASGAALDEQIAEVDLTVSIADDVNPLLVEAFMTEVPDRVTDFAACVDRISQGDTTHELLYDAQRVAHTIKGSSNITGVPGLAHLMHDAEDILEYLCTPGASAEADTVDALQQSSDCLEAMMDHLVNGTTYPEEARDVYGNLARVRAKLLGGESTPTDAGESVTSVAEADAPTVSIADETDAPRVDDVEASRDATPQDAAKAPADDAVEATVRLGLSRVDSLQQLAGEISIANFRLEGFRDDALRSVHDLARQQSVLRERLEELEDLVVIKGVKANTITAEDEDQGDEFDILEMDEYTELHSVTNALTEAVVDVVEMTNRIEGRFKTFEDLLVDHDRAATELADSVMSVRMVSAQGLTPRLQRIVRQTCRSTGKRAKLVVEGDDIEIDNDVAKALTDPLMHIIRNAIDHGLETPEEREAAGKDPEGTLTISFRRLADDVVVDCRDDGRGFDFGEIRSKAIERGLIQAEALTSEKDLARLTLLPGFSTREGVNQISGRGIGMNVVLQEVVDRRGSIDIDSVSGKGSTITIRMPLTLVSMHMILVSEGGLIFAVPSNNISQLVSSEMGEYVLNDDGIERSWALVMNEESWKLRSLGELIGRGDPLDTPEELGERPILLLETTEGKFAVLLEQATTTGRLVVKNFGSFIPRLPGVIGGSILSDGSISPVLDVRDLVSAKSGPRSVDALRVETAAMPSTIGDVLVVDDSLSARRTLVQLMNDAGFETREARDGLEAVDMIDEKVPALVLTDMEMPRMNGVELVRHLRAQDVTRHVPAIMITSRSTQKHREQALDAGVNDYVTKPWNEDELVETATTRIFGASADVA